MIASNDVVVPLALEVGDVQWRFFSTVTTFGTRRLTPLCAVPAYDGNA